MLHEMITSHSNQGKEALGRLMSRGTKSHPCQSLGGVIFYFFLRVIFGLRGKLSIASLLKEDPRPHVLLLDWHSSHVYNREFLGLMKNNNVHVVCLSPLHTSPQPASGW